MIMYFTSEFCGYIHQCYLDQLVEKICLSGKTSIHIDTSEDLSDEDLKYIEKGIQTWYNSHY